MTEQETVPHGSSNAREHLTMDSRLRGNDSSETLLQSTPKIIILGRILRTSAWGGFVTQSNRVTVKKEAYRIVFWQLIFITGLALILFLLKGMQSGLSTLLGGFAYGLPNLAFVWRVFDYTGAQSAKRFITAFVMGEMVKLFLSAILFVLMAKYLPLNVLFMMLGFCGAIVAFWVASFWFGLHEQGVS